MDTSDCAFGFGTLASHAENKLGYNMKKIQVGSNLIHLLLDVWRRIIFYRHNRRMDFKVKKVKATTAVLTLGTDCRSLINTTNRL